MYAPQPPPQYEREGPQPASIPPPPTGYLPRPIPPAVDGRGEERAARRWLRIPVERPRVTLVLLAVLVLIYLPMWLSPQINNLFTVRGASIRSLITAGEWWRLITATFLHGHPLHILLNGYALYMIGMELEGLVGRLRFAAIYAISGLAGSVASYAFTPGDIPGVGASGAIFGLIGALGVYFGLHRRLFGRIGNAQFWNIIFIIVLNIGIGFLGIQFFGRFIIDNSAHIGGLLAGAAVGYVLCPRYTLGDWFNPLARNVVNVNGGRLPWVATALLGLVVFFTFLVLFLLFRAGILIPGF